MSRLPRGHVASCGQAPRPAAAAAPSAAVALALALALAALAALVGCGHTDFSEVVLRPVTAPTGSVAIFVKGKDPARPFYDVALVQAVGSGNESDPEEVVAALAARGGQLGCDAVVRVDITQGSARTHAAGVCVKYTGTK